MKIRFKALEARVLLVAPAFLKAEARVLLGILVFPRVETSAL